MLKILWQQSSPQTHAELLGNQLQTVAQPSPPFCSWPTMFPFSLSLYPVVVFKSKVKQGLKVTVESFAISTEVQESEHGQGVGSKSQKWSIKEFQTKSP